MTSVAAAEAAEVSGGAALGSDNGIGSNAGLDDANNPESEKPPPVCGVGSKVSDSELGALTVAAEGETTTGCSSVPGGSAAPVAGTSGPALIGTPKYGS